MTRTPSYPLEDRPIPHWLASVRQALRREPVLTAVGAFGLVVTGICAVAVIGRGSFVAPEGHLSEAARFTFGVAVFSLTMARLLPLADWSAGAKRRWRISYCIFAVYGLILEPTQAFRGLDPRFSEAGSSIDSLFGVAFGVTAVIMTVTFVVLGLHFLRAGVLSGRPLLRTGIRYGSLAVFVSFGIGIVMSANSGREIDPEGDLMAAHMLGVHGIQAIPLVTLMLVGAGTTGRAKVAARAAGVGWLGAALAAAIQALLGRPAIEASTLPAIMIVGLVLWATAAGYPLLLHRRRRLLPADGRRRTHVTSSDPT